MKYLYRLLSSMTPFLFRIGSLFDDKIKQGMDGRKNQIYHKFESCIWVHCASLGEYDMALPIIQSFTAQNENVVVTFFSPSGKEIVTEKKSSENIYYLPFDNINSLDPFLQAVHPKLVCFIKAEIWPNTLEYIQSKDIPNTLLSSVFTEDSIYFKPYMLFITALLKKMDYISTQDSNSFQVLNQSGFQNAEFTGNPRIDSILKRKSECKDLIKIKEWSKDSFLIVLGSSWSKEEKMMSEIFDSLPDDTKLLIAPHDIERSETTYLTFKQYHPSFYINSEDTPSDGRIMILNTIGHLADAYQYADAVVIGGGFEQGIHNILEPSVYEIPVAFGPKYSKFPEAENLVKRNAVFVINNKNDLAIFLSESRNNEYRKQVKSTMHQFFEENRGATEKIMKRLNSLLTDSYDD